MGQRERIRLAVEEKIAQKSDSQVESAPSEHATEPATHSLLAMQRIRGNQAVRRMLARVQRNALEEGGPLSDEISAKINDKRGGGSALDSSLQAKMAETMGHDFSGVRVHTDGESDQLNRSLSAKAFTTGQDIFFRQDTYNPGSEEGQHLIAHELTHVVQQSGSTPGSNLTLGPAQDSYESEADHVASQTVGAVQTRRDAVQRQSPEEDEMVQAMRDGTLQRQSPEEDEIAQAMRDSTLQRQSPEEEEMSL